MSSTIAHAQSAVPYDTMVDLGTLGGNSSYGEDVSADGSVVVGSSRVGGEDGDYHAFVWTPEGGMQDLGTLGGDYSWARGVSLDGGTVVGYSNLTNNFSYHAFRWTEAGGMQDLGTLGGNYSYAHDVNANGNVVVGQSNLAGDSYSRAFRWTEAGGMQDLGTLGGNWSYARAVDDSGDVVVGQSNLAGDSYSRAFRWTEAGGMQDLGTLGGNYSWASDVSGDGLVVVGESNAADSYYRAFRWTEAGGMQDLGTLGGSYSWARTVNQDGSVVVGQSHLAADSGSRAFRWTEAGGMQDLGTLGGNWSYGEDVSADGSVIVGSSDTGGEYNFTHAFRWTEDDGMVDLGTLGGNWSHANAVSADGSTIVGQSDNEAGESRAFIYRNRMQDFTNMIASFGAMANDLDVATEYQRDTASWLVDGGCAPREGQTFCVGADGLLTLTSANVDLLIGKRNSVAAKVSAGARLGSALTVGAGLAIVDHRNQIGAINPDTGYAYGAWLDYAPGGDSLQGVKARVAFAMAEQGNRFDRGFGFGGVEVTSGNADIKTTTLRGEVGYGLGVGAAVVTPVAGLTWQRSKLKAFDEAPGDFPASFAGQSFDTTYATGGVEISIPTGSSGRFTLGGKVDVDLNHDVIGLVGSSQIPGMESFAVGSSIKRHDVRGRAEAGFAQQVGPGVVSVNAEVGTPTFGGHARIRLGVGFGIGF